MLRTRKFLIFLLAIVVCFAGLTALGALQVNAATTSIAAMQIGKSTAYINAKKTMVDTTNSKVVPLIKGGKTMIPLRFCASAMGGSTKYIDDKSYITVTANSLKAQFKIGSKTLRILNTSGKVTKTITLDVAPVKTNGRVMVPVRAITQGLGYKVHYQKIGSNEYVLVSAKTLTSAQNKEEIGRLQGKLNMKLSITLPKANAKVSGSIKIAGYALSEYTTKITIKVDGKTLTTNATRYLDNAILSANNSKYKAGSPKPGFTYTLNTASYSKGTHTITVTATGSDGRIITATRNFSVTTEPTVLPANKAYIPYGKITSPTNATITNPKSITIKGWAVHAKATRVDIYINGSKKGTATQTANASIVESYPSFTSITSKPGFSYTWDASSASFGRQEIVAKVVETSTGNTVQNIKSVIFLVPPTANSSLAKVTISSGTLNVRATANADGKLIGSLTKGQIVYLLSTSNSTWWKIKTLDEKLTGYASSTYLTKTSSTYSSGVSSFSLTAQSSLKNPAVGQTLYIAASSGGSNVNKKVVWKSSNTKVADVFDGYVYAYQTGTVTITAKNVEGTSTVTRTVTVSAGEPVITAYASPNIVNPGDTVNIIVVTDSNRDCVKAVVDNGNGTTTTLTKSSYAISGMRRIFTISTSVAKAGTYSVKVYARSGGTYSSTIKTISIFASSNYNSSTPKVETRRPTDKGLNFIAAWEGYSKEVYVDSLGTPTIGYGLAIFGGNTFYDVLSAEEAWAMLVSTANGSYSTKTSDFLKNNKIAVTQWEYDSLVSFAYNVGANIWTTTSKTYKCKLRDILQAKAGSSAGSIADSTVVDAFTRYHKNLRGVYYRRLDEAQMFNSGNYTRDNWAYAPYSTCTLPEKDGAV